MKVTAQVAQWRRGWEITIPEVDVVTQAPTLDEVPREAADAVAVALDIDPSDVEVRVVQ